MPQGTGSRLRRGVLYKDEDEGVIQIPSFGLLKYKGDRFIANLKIESLVSSPLVGKRHLSGAEPVPDPLTRRIIEITHIEIPDDGPLEARCERRSLRAAAGDPR